MANVFLNGEDRDVETALLLENANVLDIHKAVAYTDGKRVFINTDDNLARILPAYDKNMLKWILWHERMHMELSHHNRFFKYLEEIEEAKALDEFHVSKDEVNIIMDILVHDWMAAKFPELVETAVNNCAQMRNRNSLLYTFKTHTLEEMLDEYAKFKEAIKDMMDEQQDDQSGDGSESEDKESDKESDGEKDGQGEQKESGDSKKKQPKSEQKQEDADEDENEGEHKSNKKGHSGSDESEQSSNPDDAEENNEVEVGVENKPAEPEPEPEHDKTDWSQLDTIDTNEFITERAADYYEKEIEKLKRKKIKLARLTQTLNGLVTSQRVRTYAVPSRIQIGSNVILKGRQPGRATLYLIFDASGSMGEQLKTFKKIITQAIPQALETPTEWFSGYVPSNIERKCYNEDSTYQGSHYSDYYKGKFKDILQVEASSGYGDDGDRTIELCLKAEEKGYTPIGVTDGGGGVYYPETLKKLKRTILIGQSETWLETVKEINPHIQTLLIPKYYYD